MEDYHVLIKILGEKNYYSVRVPMWQVHIF